MVRDMPHMLRAILVSSTGVTSMPSSVLATLISSGTVKESSPLGPFILTVWPVTVAVTLDGTGTGSLPMRDMGVQNLRKSSGAEPGIVT